MNYNYNYYYHSNKKNSKYLDGLSKRIGFVTIIVLLLVVLKISNSYNQNNIINKLEAIYKKDYTSNINTIVLKYKDLPNTFVNNFNSSTENFKLEFLPIEGEILRGFGQYTDEESKKTFYNNGVDIAINDKIEAKCVFDGKIDRVENTKENNIVVTVLHTNGYQTKYYNLSEIVKDVGDEVKKGDVIGKVDKEKSKYMHFEVIKNGNYIDPINITASSN